MMKYQHWECPVCHRGYCCAPGVTPAENPCRFHGVPFEVVGDCNDDEDED